MKQDEFDEQIQRLISAFGERDFPQERIKLFWLHLKSIDQSWFKNEVDQMIATMNPKYNLIGAIKQERINKNATQQTYNEIYSYEKVKKESMTNDGLKLALEKIGAKNLLEAIEKVNEKDEIWWQK